MRFEHDPAPRRPLSPGERLGALSFGLVLLGLVLAELASDGDPRKLSVLFIVLSWYPLLAIHEFGHAFVAAALGWRVHEIVLGVGPQVAVLRLLGAPLRVRLIPAGGYVVPSPRTLEGARARSAAIYAAGPAAELLAAGLLVLAWGPAEVLAPTTSAAVIAVQSFGVAAVLGAAMNLWPTSFAGGASDGLGIFYSLGAPEEHFRYRMVQPHLASAQKAIDQGKPETALSNIDGALQDQPEDPFLRAMRARCLSAGGDHDGALTLLAALRDEPTWSDLAEAERLHAAAVVALQAPGSELLVEGERACRGAIERKPGDVSLLSLHGELLLSLDRHEDAARVLQRAYNTARDTQHERRILLAMATAAEARGRRDEADRLRMAAARVPEHP